MSDAFRVFSAIRGPKINPETHEKAARAASGLNYLFVFLQGKLTSGV
jgi:hypothetical protein